MITITNSYELDQLAQLLLGKVIAHKCCPDTVALAKLITINQGVGITIAEVAAQKLSASPLWTIAHADTSAVVDLTTTALQVIDTMTFDSFGHVINYTLKTISAGVGTVTSVGLSMPTAFTVINSPITTSGTIVVTGAGNTAQYVRGDGSLATLPVAILTANNGLITSGTVVQLGQPWGQAGNPAAMIGNREITTGVGNNQFRFITDTGSASLRIHFGETGNGGGPGIVHLDDQSYSQIGFKYVGMDPGFVRDDVINTCTPPLSTAIGLSYTSVASGFACKNTYEGQIGQFYLGVTGGPFADNCLGIFSQVCAGIKLAAAGAGYIRFSGNVLEGSGEYGRFATTTGYFGLGTSTPSARLDVNDNTIRLRTARTITTSTDAGNAGDVCWDSSYIYICISTNVWKRSPITTW